MPEQNLIPRFFLYGEARSEVELDFLHIEKIRLRSGAHNWIIGPHAHPDHAQILLITQGGGSFRVESELWRPEPPSLILVPVGAVHAMEFRPDTDGFVITVARSYLEAAIPGDKELAAATSRAGHYFEEWEVFETYGIPDAFQELEQEFVWSAPGRRTAIRVHLLRILIALTRLQYAARLSGQQTDSRDAELVSLYRELVEHHFRQDLPLASFASKLNVTQSRLNAACRLVTGRTALKLIHDRLMIEAKRNLIYTNKSVAEVAYAVGFQDPTYFSRFFSQRAGIPPGAFRQAMSQSGHGGYEVPDRSAV
jgi:AraC family transcriptional activator of pobA